MAGIDWEDPQVQQMLRELGPVTASIAGSQEREFAHEKGMQSQDLSAKSSMHKSSLANAMAIEKLRSGTQRYGIDVESETARRGQDFQQMQARWTNAMNYLSLASQLRGSENYFQQSNLYRGAPGAGFPAFLQDLLSDQGIGGMVSGGSNLQGFGAQSGQATPVSMQSLIQGLSTGMQPGEPSGTPGTATASAAPGTPGQGLLSAAPSSSGGGLLGSINQIAQNMHRLAPGSLEALDEDEMGLLQSGFAASGHNLPGLLRIYGQSRPAQGSATAA